MIHIVYTMYLGLLLSPSPPLGEVKENVSLTKEALKNEKDVTTARINGGRNNESQED